MSLEILSTTQGMRDTINYYLGYSKENTQLHTAQVDAM